MPYYSIPGGGLAFNGQGYDPIPDGWVEVDEATYEAQLEVIEEAVQDAEDAAAEADNLARKAAYDDLKASRHTDDWDDATIRLITGYYGE